MELVLKGPMMRVGLPSPFPIDEGLAKFEISKISDRLITVYDGDSFEGKRVSFPEGDFTTLAMDLAGM